MLVILAAFVLAVLWVWKSIEAHNLLQQLTHLEKTKTQLIENNKHLRAELERYHSITWIDGCVRSGLQMTHDAKGRLVLVEEPAGVPRQNRNLFASLGDMAIKALKAFLK